MNLDAQSILKRRRYEELMQAGRTAYKQGNRRLAHDQWREAATVDPYNEQVWLTLFRVLDSDEDRIACLENIIAINPMNVQARRRLRAYQEHPSAAPVAKPAAPARRGPNVKPSAAKAKSKRPASKPRPAVKAKPERKNSAGRVIALVVIAVLLVVLLAIAVGVYLGTR